MLQLTPQTKIVIVSHGSVIESSLRAHFFARGYMGVMPVGSFDPLNGVMTAAFFEREKPDVVILGSVRSGGIAENQAHPAELIRENLLAQAHVIDAAYRSGVKKLLFLGASCMYPKEAAQPIKEEYFLQGPMEPTSLPYAAAKAAGVVMCQAYRREYGFNAIAAVPATVYSLQAGHESGQEHVLGALIGKFDTAVREKWASVELLGTGNPKREFIFGDDLAAACVCLLEKYDGESPVNIGTGEEIAVRDLADMVAAAAGFTGKITWDLSKPDGAMFKLLDSARLKSLGWDAQVSLKEGIRRVFEARRSGT